MPIKVVVVEKDTILTSSFYASWIAGQKGKASPDLETYIFLVSTPPDHILKIIKSFHPSSAVRFSC